MPHPAVPIDIEMKMSAKAGELVELSRDLLTAIGVPPGMDMQASIDGGAIQSILVYLSGAGADDIHLAGIMADVIGIFCAEMEKPAMVFEAIANRALFQMMKAQEAGVSFTPRDRMN